MKKFIILAFISLLFVSCGVYYNESYSVATYGDISVMDYNGKPIRSYKNSLISNEEHNIITYYGQKTDNITDRFNGTKIDGSINFIDADNEAHYISGGIIIIDNVKVVNGYADTKYGKNQALKTAAYNQKESDIADYHNIVKEHKYFLGELKKFKKNSKDYKILKEKVDSLEKEKKDKEQFLWDKYRFSDRISY